MADQERYHPGCYQWNRLHSSSTFECRGKPVILEKPAPLDQHNNGAGVAPNGAAIPPAPRIASPTGLIVGYNQGSDVKKASDFFNVEFFTA